MQGIGRRYRQGISEKQEKLAILKAKYGDVCWYCGISLNGILRNIDHIIPCKRGGTNDIENLSLTCSYCNFAKNTHCLEQLYWWFDHIRSNKFKSHLPLEEEFHPLSNLIVR